MKSGMMVRLGGVLPFVRFLESIGAPTTRLLEQTKVAYFNVGDSETLVPAIAVYRFIERAARQEGISDLAFLVAQRTALEVVGAYGRAVRASSNACEGLHTAMRLLPAFSSDSRLRLARYGPHLRLSHEFHDEVSAGAQVRVFSLLWLIKVLQQAAGADWWPAEIHLRTRRTRETVRMEELTSARVSYGQSACAVVFSEACLRLAYKPAGHCARRHREEELKLLRSAPPADFLAAARYVIASLLPGGHPRIDEVAEVLNQPVRSMQRTLAERALSYSGLVQQVRFDRSRDLLSRSDASITSIAFDLGYSDMANFTRAFRRWTGLSPRAYRRQCMATSA